jgi:putative hemolysin
VLDLIIVLVLIMLNGLFALSELAVVSSRPARLKAMADAGRAGARKAQLLAADPSRFLSTVQVGITLIGIITGSYSGAAFGDRMSQLLLDAGLPARAAEIIGVGSVIVIITYLSVIIGELVPKNLALRNAEGLACAVAPVMSVVSKLAAPAVWLLDGSTQLLFGLFGGGTDSKEVVTEEEIRAIMAEGESAGVLEAGERRMISGVMRLADRKAGALMTARGDVDWIDLDAGEESMRKRLMSTEHSRLPAGRGRPDHIVGVVQTRELLSAALAGEPLNMEAHVRPAPAVHENIDALDVLEVLRGADVPMALVHDEYGHFQGLITPADILEAVAGAFKSDMDATEAKAVERDDGSWLLSGWMPVDEMAERLALPLPVKRDYQTVAGFVLAHMHHIPDVGEKFGAGGWQFEVVDLDGRRIDKVLASRKVAPHRLALGTAASS